MEMTITEALQEITTLQKRLEKARAAILPYICRDSRVVDPLAKQDGGSVGFVARQRQAITDLEQRLVDIRTAIQMVNLKAELTIDKTTRTVAQWLNWRREISEHRQRFLASMGSQIALMRAQLQNQRTGTRTALAQPTEAAVPVEITLNLDEARLLAEQDEMEALLGALDGKLSLFNATQKVDIA